MCCLLLHPLTCNSERRGTEEREEQSGSDESPFSRGRSKSGRGTSKAVGQPARWRLQLKTAIFGSIQQRIEKKDRKMEEI